MLITQFGSISRTEDGILTDSSARKLRFSEFRNRSLQYRYGCAVGITHVPGSRAKPGIMRLNTTTRLSKKVFGDFNFIELTIPKDFVKICRFPARTPARGPA
eukprot:COSAG02_NODE_961_length_15629_cov_2.747650_17_plen_102_part_00